MTKIRLCLLISPLLLLLAVPAGAAKKHAPAAAHPEGTAPHPRPLGGAGEWEAYAFREKSGPVCYLYGHPVKTEPKNGKRRAPVAMVTHRPDEHVFDVISFTEFYPLKAGSSVSLDVGGSKFDLFTHGDTAWSPTAETDKTIVETMRKGRDAVVTASPLKGPRTTDTYSLTGFTKALSLIDKACDVKR
jgi:hypothetical protein